jgi:putative ABC transport system permease protein
MLWKLAFRNIFRNRTRSLITLSAIAVACASLIITAGFIADSVSQLQENFIRSLLGHLRVARRGYFEKGLADPYSYMISDYPGIIRRIKSFPNIIEVTPRLEFPGLLSTGQSTLAFLSQAVDPQAEERVNLNFEMREGHNLTSHGDFEVIVGRGLAEAMGIHAKDSVTLVGNTTRGGINAIDVTVAGVFRTVSKEFDDHAVRVSLGTAQRLLRTPDVQTLTVILKKTEDTDRLCSAIGRLFQKEALDLEVRPWHKLPAADFVVKLVPYYDRLFGVLRAIILVMVILSIFNTMNMAVLERIGEIGTIAALGTRRRNILKLFIAEGALLGLLGAAMGLVIGMAGAKLISWMGIPMGTPPGSTINWIARIRIVPSVCLSACASVFLIAIVSAVLPALKAARLEIADALRHNL